MLLTLFSKKHCGKSMELNCIYQPITCNACSRPQGLVCCLFLIPYFVLQFLLGELWPACATHLLRHILIVINCMHLFLPIWWFIISSVLVKVVYLEPLDTIENPQKNIQEIFYADARILACTCSYQTSNQLIVQHVLFVWTIWTIWIV